MGAKIAHEIRNPLAAISGSIQILRQGIASGRSEYERARLMDIVVREADRLSRLITDFLRFARPRPMRVEPVETGALLEDLASVFEAARPDDVEMVLGPLEPIRMAGDPDQLRQVFWNLCINAIQAMPEGGTLHLSARSIEDESPQGGSGADRNGAEGAASADDGGYVEVVVRDTGIGIPGEVQDRMFEPFFTTKREGSGLGLAMVHRIVESHGGSVQLESEAGLGSTFRVRLPRWEGSG
jgi:two-component system sensor histidine kinase PilS (NtrC family)